MSDAREALKECCDMLEPVFRLYHVRGGMSRDMFVSAIAICVGTYFGSVDHENYSENINAVRDQLNLALNGFLANPPPFKGPAVVDAEADHGHELAMMALETLMRLRGIEPPEQKFIIGLGKAIEAYEKIRYPLPSVNETEKGGEE